MRIRHALALIAVLIAVPRAAAAPLAIVNPGFEDLYFGSTLPAEYAGDVPPTAFPTGPAPNGWAPYGAVGGNAFIGVLNPGIAGVHELATNFPAGAPEGDNLALAFFDSHAGGLEFGIQQVLVDTLQANTRYTLSVEVGDIASGTSSEPFFNQFGFFDLRGFPGYRIDLMAGTEPIVQDLSTLAPGDGLFATSTIEVSIGIDHDQLGEQLAIRLVNLNQQDIDDPEISLEVDFDNVRLDATPFTPGDYNGNGTLDAADYTVWRDTLTAAGSDLLNDPTPGTVDESDFQYWRDNFGATLGSGAVSVTAVPEPTSGALFLAGLLAMVFHRRLR